MNQKANERRVVVLSGGPGDGLRLTVNTLKPTPVITIPTDGCVGVYKKSHIDKINGTMVLVYEFTGLSPEAPKLLKPEIVA